MPEREAGEGPARVWIGVRRALAGEVRREQQALASRASSGPPRRRASLRSTPSTLAEPGDRPPPDSITPIACHVPGTAWQKVCTRASRPARSEGAPRRRARRAERDRDGPGPVDADPERGGGLVAGAADLGRLARGRQPFERDLERGADLVRPARGRRHRTAASPTRRRRRWPARRSGGGGRSPSEAARAGSARTVSGSCRRSQSSFGAVNPASARFPVSEIRRSRPTRSSISAHSAAGAAVVPEDRRPDHAIAASSTTSPCICPDRPIGPDGQPRQSRLGRAPPVLGILLGPARTRRRKRVPSSARPSTRPSGSIATALTPVVPTSRRDRPSVHALDPGRARSGCRSRAPSARDGDRDVLQPHAPSAAYTSS